MTPDNPAPDTGPAPAPDTGPAPETAPSPEEQALLAEYARDPMSFEHYRGHEGTGQTGAERLFALQQARKADAEKAAAPQTAPAASDDSTDADAEAIAPDAPAPEADDDDDGSEGGEPLQYDLEDYTYTPPEG